jgi:hypothetical protein
VIVALLLSVVSVSSPTINEGLYWNGAAWVAAIFSNLGVTPYPENDAQQIQLAEAQVYELPFQGPFTH